jgi:hypothetical protein
VRGYVQTCSCMSSVSKTALQLLTVTHSPQANSDICATHCVCNVRERKTHLRFCAELHKIETKTYELFKTKNQKAMSSTQVFEYFCCSKGGRTSIGSDGHSGYHSPRTNVTLIAELCDLVTADRRLIIRK